MARPATSVLEVAQIARVRGLLSDFVEMSDLTVTRTDGKSIKGRLVQDLLSSKVMKKGGPRAYFGMVTLATTKGQVEIDYLDIVMIKKAVTEKPVAAKPSAPPKRSRRKQPKSSRRKKSPRGLKDYFRS